MALRAGSEYFLPKRRSCGKENRIEELDDYDYKHDPDFKQVMKIIDG